MPAGIDIVGVWSAIYVDDGGVLLGFVEIGRAHHAVEEVCLAVDSLDGSLQELWLDVFFPGVCGCEIVGAVRFVCCEDINLSRHGRFGIAVQNELAGGRKRAVVVALAVVEQCAATCFEASTL